jgi:hypothetical protein
MNGHFHPRKSKFVFRNISISHCLPNLAGPAGAIYYDTAAPNLVPVL